jgi:GTP-binding protein
VQKVALVGRPNVGKSALFNRLTGTHRALVEDEPGVTRDRLYEATDWNGVRFEVVDTGGLWRAAGDDVLGFVRTQTMQAVAEADVVVVVVDAAAPLSTADREVADLVRRAGKPVVLAANKAERPPNLGDLYQLGLGDPCLVSATHGMGIGDLLDAVVARLREADAETEPADAPRLAVAGRPNVGKSSLLNRLVGEERALVTPIAGTTRDVVDARVTAPDGTAYVLLDTAGLRRPSRIVQELEERTVSRSLAAIRQADVVLMVLSAEDPVSHQDLRIAGQVAKHRRAVVVLLNKADLIHGASPPLVAAIRERMDFLPYARIVPVSAKTGWHIADIWPAVAEAYASFTTRVGTFALNQLVRETVAVTPPPTRGARALRILYATQVGVRPPHFVFFVNDPDLAHFSYVRHLEHRIRERWGFQGTPLRLTFRARRNRRTLGARL